MRIKISINNSRIYRNINVQDIQISHNSIENLPIIYFKCNKNLEDVLVNETIIFHNNRGKELFRSSNLRLHYRYYEDDSFRQNKVKFMVKNIEFEDCGKVSRHYISKVLKKTCNIKKILAPPIKQVIKPKLSVYGIGVMRYIERAKIMKRRPPLYKEYIRKIRYICVKVKENIYKIIPLSKAPT